MSSRQFRIFYFLSHFFALCFFAQANISLKPLLLAQGTGATQAAKVIATSEVSSGQW